MLSVLDSHRSVLLYCMRQKLTTSSDVPTYRYLNLAKNALETLPPIPLIPHDRR